MSYFILFLKNIKIYHDLNKNFTKKNTIYKKIYNSVYLNYIKHFNTSYKYIFTPNFVTIFKM